MTPSPHNDLFASLLDDALASPTSRDFDLLASCSPSTSHNHCGRVLRKERGQVLHPSMVILTRRRPDELLAEPEIFKPTQHPGIWINGSWELGPIIVVSSTRLPEEPEFDWMRMCVRVPDNLEDVERATALIKRSKTDKLTRQRLEETMFDFMYVDGVHFLEYAEKLKEEHEARLREAEEKARIEAELRYTTEIQQLKADLAALKAKIDDQEKST